MQKIAGCNTNSFHKRGMNPAMDALVKPSLPVELKQMNSIASAVRKYFLFLKAMKQNG